MTSLSTSTPAGGPLQTAVRSVPIVRPWPEWALCLALAALWFGCTAWLRPLAIPDEGRYVGVAWEMLRSGDWLVPTLDGLPFFHKPPLFYWITAGSMAVFGPGVVAARAAAWLASTGMLAGLFVFTRRWGSAPQAWLTVAVLATAPLFYGAAQYANMDILVAACITAAILFFAHALLARSQGLAHRTTLAAAFAAAALGVLAKGLIDAVLPLLVLAAWGLATRRLGRVLALLVWAPGCLLFAVIAAPWFIAVQHRFPGFGHYFFIVQHVDRYASGGFNNPQPWWFYPIALLLLTLPWSPWLAAGLRRRDRDASDRMPADLRTLMGVWVGVIVVFFSVPSSKPVGYILPALVPLAFLIADAARRAGVGAAARTLGSMRGAIWSADKRFAATVLFAAAACVSLTVAAHFLQPKSRAALAEQLRVLKRPGEAVFFLANYYYDVSFYARLDEPVAVVDPWLPAEVAKDSWRRELSDAAQLAPSPSARRLLLPTELAPALCRARTSWLLGPSSVSSAAPAWLAGLTPVAQSGATALWRVDTAAPDVRAALHCDAGPAF